MKRQHSFLIILALVIFQTITFSQESSRPVVTYIANEGFLLSCGEDKILVDAIFGGIKGNWCEQPSDSVINLMVNGQPPFDRVDVVLVTHRHTDHFNENIVSRVMLQNSNTMIVCPDQVNDQLKKLSSYSSFSDRVRPIPSHNIDTTFSIGSVKVRAVNLNHGSFYEKDSVTGEVHDLHKDVENVAYIVKSNGSTFVHSGDAAIKSFEKYESGKFETDTVDFAFMDRIFMKPEGMKVIGEIIQPQMLIFMHIEPDRVDYYKNIIKGFPGMFIFSKPMETIVF